MKVICPCTFDRLLLEEIMAELLNAGRQVGDAVNDLGKILENKLGVWECFLKENGCV